MPDVVVGRGYRPGSTGRIAELHGTTTSCIGISVCSSKRVATELSQFLDRYRQTRDGFWTARVGGRIEGAIAIDAIHAEDEGALRGKGIGCRLIATAVSFCRASRYPRIYLWTFAGLDSAKHLYEKFGFRLTEERDGAQWGTRVTEQRFELLLG